MLSFSIIIIFWIFIYPLGDSRRFPNENFAPMGGIVRVFDPLMYRSHLYREGDTEAEFTQRLLDQMEVITIIDFWLKYSSLLCPLFFGDFCHFAVFC